MIALPWPNRALSPNSRVHYLQRHRAAQKAKHDAFYATKAAAPEVPTEGPIAVRLVLCPPNANRRDLDNALASCKSLLDGMAQALGVDDSRFRPFAEWGEVKTGGEVRAELGVVHTDFVPFRGTING